MKTVNIISLTTLIAGFIITMTQLILKMPVDWEVTVPMMAGGLFTQTPICKDGIQSLFNKLKRSNKI